jgi:hypothetical protein
VKLRLSFILSFIFLFFNKASAQFSDTTSYLVGLTATGTYNQTNLIRTYLLNNTLRTGIRKKSVAVNGVCKWLYGKQNEKRTNNDLSATLDVNLYKTFDHFYYWGLFVYNNIYSLRVNQQVQTGAGAAYNLIETKQLQLNLSDGIIYDYNDVLISDTIRDVYETYRNSFRLQVKYSIKNLNFRTAAFIQNSFEYKNDFIIKGEMSLSIKVRRHLNFTMQGNYNRMSRTKKETIFLTYGLTYERYF